MSKMKLLSPMPQEVNKEKKRNFKVVCLCQEVEKYINKKRNMNF